MDELRLILERGDAARRLLEDPAFVSVMNDLSDAHLKEMVASRPGPEGEASRTNHHLLLHALREIESTLRVHVDIADDAQRRLEEAQDMTTNHEAGGLPVFLEDEPNG